MHYKYNSNNFSIIIYNNITQTGAFFGLRNSHCKLDRLLLLIRVDLDTDGLSPVNLTS